MDDLPDNAFPGEIHRSDNGLWYRLDWCLLAGQRPPAPPPPPLRATLFGLEERRAIAEEVRREGRQRRDGWTRERRIAMLACLADGCSITEASRLVGMSRQSFRTLRERAPVLSSLVDRLFAAPTEPTHDCRPTRFDRAADGRLKPIVRGGRLVGCFHRPDDRAALSLLSAAHRRGLGDVTGQTG